jgi:uncharacterized protein YndB with AHSA1/START domain
MTDPGAMTPKHSHDVKDKDGRAIHPVELEFRRALAASPERVFDALTRAEHIAHWFCDDAESEPRQGGRLVLTWKRPGASVQPFAGTWIAFDAPHMCAFEGGQPDHPDGYAGHVDWMLEAIDGGTRLLTVHRMPPTLDYAPLAALYALAWPRALDRLVAYLTPQK